MRHQKQYGVQAMSDKKDTKLLFLGFSIEFWTVGYGLTLTLWGLAISILSKSNSITSWIPAMIGIPMLISGLMGLKVPQQKKVWMHIALIFGIISLIGGLDLLRGLSSYTSLTSNLWATFSKLLLLIGGALYSFACIKSFLWARKQRVKTLA